MSLQDDAGSIELRSGDLEICRLAISGQRAH